MRLNIISSDKAKLALTMAGALFLIWLVQPTVTEWLGKDKSADAVSPKAVNLNSPEVSQTPTPTAPSAVPGADPFKAHIEKNGLAPIPAAPNTTVVNAAGADPFKAFLEKQKQASKDAGVSPFGK